MKVLLCEDVKSLGWLGDVVEVNAGYARNYLLPQGIAKPATEGNLRAIAKEKVARAEERKFEKELLEKVAIAVEGAEAVVAAKANEQGVLFGSVGSSQIAQNLREHGFEVADEFVALGEHIKQVGTSQVTLKFADELTATVSVVVVPEGGDVEAIKAAEAEKAAQTEDTISPKGPEGEDITAQQKEAEQEIQQKEAEQGGESEPVDEDS
jgi:large subunit ribosomal protein L9